MSSVHTLPWFNVPGSSTFYLYHIPTTTEPHGTGLWPLVSSPIPPQRASSPSLLTISRPSRVLRSLTVLSITSPSRRIMISSRPTNSLLLSVTTMSNPFSRLRVTNVPWRSATGGRTSTLRTTSSCTTLAPSLCFHLRGDGSHGTNTLSSVDSKATFLASTINNKLSTAPRLLTSSTLSDWTFHLVSTMPTTMI